MRSNKKLESKTEQLSIINQFSSSLLQITCLDELFEYVTSHVVNKLGFVECVIYLSDKQTAFLEEVACMGLSNDYHVKHTRISIDQGITGFVARNKTSFVTGDVTNEPLYIADSRPALSEICVPLVYENSLIGVIDCEHPQKDYFTDSHLQILSTVAHLLSAKIYQLRIVNNLSDTVNKLNQAQQLEKCLLKIANITHKSQSLTSFYNDLYRIINTQIPAENFLIGLYNKATHTLEIKYLVEDEAHIQTQYHLTEQQLKRSATHYILMSNLPLLCNRTQFSALVNEGKFDMIGRPPSSWLGVPFEINDKFKGVIVIQSFVNDEAFTYHHSSILTYISGQVSMAVDRQLSREALEYRALHDELTGLANRYLLLERVKHAILNHSRNKKPNLHCLLYLDLDRFKSINDSLGHDVGDHFLVSIVNLVKKCIRKTDTFARLGGDEFAIFMENIQQEETVSLAIERIYQAIEKPLQIQGHTLQASTSIGVAYTKKDSDCSITLLQQADAAMYEAKSRGRGNVCYFNDVMRDQLKQHADIENDLQNGIKNNEFELYYQPIFTLTKPHIVSFEALVRWHHPKNGLVSPDDFIPIAEQTGQIIELDLHLLEVAAKQIHTWITHHIPIPQVTVNVSPRHFASLEFVGFIKQLYARYQLPKGVLCLEIVESGLIENLALATEIIKGLEPLGVKLYLDDFGTGYSALGYLDQLPIHVLKIDKSFVDQLITKENPLIDAILSLARSLCIPVVAEGIETPKQWALLKHKGCNFGQGYIVSKPLPGEQAMQKLLNDLELTEHTS